VATVPESALARTDLDAVALKPAEHRLERATELPVPGLVVDFEGREHLPAPATLRSLADTHAVRATVPVRADGFDPLGDDNRLGALPETVGRVLVAGNPAYLREAEQERVVAPRLRAAAAAARDPWIGTESVERLALAVGGTQFELLSASTATDVRALRAAGYDGAIAVYAPTVLTEEDEAVLDALGAYAARRRPVRQRLSAEAATDSDATGAARNVLREAIDDYSLVGTPDDVASQVASLREAGVDTVVGYPARGLDAVLE
jgi:alkanesulfonate monooxygenase SsuD/methylene tetrahydromethanopterin reductase-like flavin-dependent oxidoreductase (luciferase family)